MNTKIMGKHTHKYSIFVGVLVATGHQYLFVTATEGRVDIATQAESLGLVEVPQPIQAVIQKLHENGFETWLKDNFQTLVGHTDDAGLNPLSLFINKTQLTDHSLPECYENGIFLFFGEYVYILSDAVLPIWYGAFRLIFEREKSRSSRWLRGQDALVMHKEALAYEFI